MTALQEIAKRISVLSAERAAIDAKITALESAKAVFTDGPATTEPKPKKSAPTEETKAKMSAARAEYWRKRQAANVLVPPSDFPGPL